MSPHRNTIANEEPVILEGDKEPSKNLGSAKLLRALCIPFVNAGTEEAEKILSASDSPRFVFKSYSSHRSEAVKKRITSEHPNAIITSIPPLRSVQESGSTSVSPHRDLRKLLRLSTPEISPEKQALIERMASKAVLRLEEALWDVFPKLMAKNLQRPSSAQKDNSGKEHGPGDYAELIKLIPKIVDNRSACKKLILGLVSDVQNTFWVEVKTTLIEKRKCDYSPWLKFFLEGSGKHLQIKLLMENHEPVYGLGYIEAGTDDAIRAVAEILKENLPGSNLRIEWGTNPDGYQVFIQFLSYFLKQYLRKIVNDRVRSLELSGAADYKNFFALAKSIGYLSCLGLMYAFHTTLHIPSRNSIEFLGNGTFLRHLRQIEFEPADTMLNLIHSNASAIEIWNR